MGEDALPEREPHAAGNSRACGGVTHHGEQLDRQERMGDAQDIHHHHTRGATEKPVPATGRTKQRHHGQTGGGTVPEHRRGGHHIQTVQCHQEDGDGSRALGHHIGILRPAQMAARIRPHAGEGSDAAA